MDWQYHNEIPKAGRRLILLSMDELLLAGPLIYRSITLNSIRYKPENYSVSVNKNIIENRQLLTSFDLYNQVFENLKAVIEIRKNKTNVEQANVKLQELNQALNLFFSDLGWRQVRKEISQIKKRQKKGHIEVSKDIINKLKHFMDKNQFDSFDQALDTLLTDFDQSVDD